MIPFELVLSPALYDYRTLQHHHLTVAVDVLRATTAICAAFHSGAEEIVPLDSLDPLPDYYRRGYTLAAERDGKKVPLASCGNSPTEYLTMDLRGQRLAYSTTNGTVSILRACQSEKLLVGCFSNLGAVARRVMDENLPVVVLCSGWKQVPCLEDTLFGGALLDRLLTLGAEIDVQDDAAKVALELWHKATSDLYGYCSKASHVHRLQRLDYDADIRFAFRLDTSDQVPYYDKERKTLVL